MSDTKTALAWAAADTCSLHCPSTKRSGDAWEWTHGERCKSVRALAADIETLVAERDSAEARVRELKAQIDAVPPEVSR